MFFSRIQRIWWQFLGVILFNIPFIGPNHAAWLPIPVLNCYACPLAQGACPIGTIQHFLVIGMIPLLTIGVLGMFAIIAGRWYCGWLCPFGFFQDLIGRIRKNKKRLPHWTGSIKYAVLVITVLILPPILNEPFFCTLCPAGSLEGGIPIVTGAWIESLRAPATQFSVTGGILDMVGWWFWFKMALLAGLIWLAVLVKRPFCRMFCPLGAILGIFNRISMWVHPPKDKLSTGKGYYLKPCPVDINLPKDVDSHHCTKCRACYHRPGEIHK